MSEEKKEMKTYSGFGQTFSLTKGNKEHASQASKGADGYIRHYRKSMGLETGQGTMGGFKKFMKRIYGITIVSAADKKGKDDIRKETGSNY